MLKSLLTKRTELKQLHTHAQITVTACIYTESYSLLMNMMISLRPRINWDSVFMF